MLRAEILGSGESRAHTPGVRLSTSRAAPRQPGSGAVCGFRISLRCHPERPADRQGSHPLSKTPFHLPGLNYTCRAEERAREPAPSLFPHPSAQAPCLRNPSPPSLLPVLKLWRQPRHLPIMASSRDKCPCLLGGRVPASRAWKQGPCVYLRVGSPGVWVALGGLLGGTREWVRAL